MVLVDDINTEIWGRRGQRDTSLFCKIRNLPIKTAFRKEKSLMFTKSNIWNLENTRLCHLNRALFCYEGYNIELRHCTCTLYHRAPLYPVHRTDNAYGTRISLIVLIVIIQCMVKDLIYLTLLPFWSEKKNKNALLKFSVIPYFQVAKHLSTWTGYSFTCPPEMTGDITYVTERIRETSGLR